MKVGEYVRTNYGEICKLLESKDKILLYSTDIEIDRYNDRDCNQYGFDNETIKDVIKSSQNIIDLIEVGDYVNGHTVKMIKEDKSKIDIGEGEDYFWLRNQDILSIVTKEQFSQMVYKIGE